VGIVVQYQLQEGVMDILVMLEENPDHSPVLAHVNSIPSPLHSSDRPSRDVVTLYGEPSLESLALALAAAVESHRSNDGHAEAIRHLGVWPERGAIGDAAWRDSTGQLVTSDLEIPLETLHVTVSQKTAANQQTHHTKLSKHNVITNASSIKNISDKQLIKILKK